MIDAAQKLPSSGFLSRTTQYLARHTFLLAFPLTQEICFQKRKTRRGSSKRVFFSNGISRRKLHKKLSRNRILTPMHILMHFVCLWRVAIALLAVWWVSWLCPLPLWSEKRERERDEMDCQSWLVRTGIEWSPKSVFLISHSEPRACGNWTKSYLNSFIHSPGARCNARRNFEFIKMYAGQAWPETRSIKRAVKKAKEVKFEVPLRHMRCIKMLLWYT